MKTINKTFRFPSLMGLLQNVLVGVIVTVHVVMLAIVFFAF